MASTMASKFKAMLPFNGGGSADSRKSKRFMDHLDPEVGFEMLLVPSSSNSQSRSNADGKSSGHQVSELHVKILGARHLPSIFGLKRVEGYVVKV